MTSPASGSKIEWYLARDGRQHGPLAESEMMKFRELGHLRPGDLVWRAGFPEWRAASTVFDLTEKTQNTALPTEATKPPRSQTGPQTGPEPGPETRPETGAAAPSANNVVTAAPDALASTKPIEADKTAETARPDDKSGAAAVVSATTIAMAPSGIPAETAVKTGIGVKKPLDTPLLSPAQLPKPAPAASAPVAALAPVQTEPTSSHPASADTQPVTSLNERLQRAASERAVGSLSLAPGPGPTVPTAPTQPLHKSWPSQAQPTAGLAGSTAAPMPPQASIPKLQPLPELRTPNPVPLMPLEPRPGNTTRPAATVSPPPPATSKRKKERKPALSVAANATPSRGRSLGIGLTLAIIVGGGGWLAYTSRGAITSMVGKPAITTASQANVSATQLTPAKPQTTEPVVEQPASIASATTAAGDNRGKDNAGKATPFVTAAKTAELIDADLKRSAVWQLIASEFPEWHRDRVTELAKLAAEKRDATAISRHMAEALVSLRRKFADQALSASPERLRAVAVAFLENLRQLSAQSTDACYGFISQGETYPAVVDLMRQGDRTEALHKQSVAVFEAVAFGRKTPQTNLPPRKVDYDTLAAELTARGWSQSDLQMFSDAKALAAAPPEQVCKMVQDWFAAQIAIKDPAVQLRLLVESLRPVVAG